VSSLYVDGESAKDSECERSQGLRYSMQASHVYNVESIRHENGVVDGNFGRCQRL